MAEGAIDDEVKAACLFAKSFDVDAESEFHMIHCKRGRPRRFDAAPETGMDLNMTFYDLLQKASFRVLGYDDKCVIV